MNAVLEDDQKLSCIRSDESKNSYKVSYQILQFLV